MHADDAVLIAENEDDLQRLLHEFNTIAQSLGMLISTSKTKCMTTSKIPLRCIEISSFGEIETEVRTQVVKATRAAAQLNDTIFRNKHLRIDTKSRIYKATIRPILTYAVETRPETSKTRQMMEAAEMKIIRRITGKSLWDRQRVKPSEEHAKSTTSMIGYWGEKFSETIT
ncbi:uncharacterized protein LOC122520182 [Polistes fuscatus]|uniref:uncharacterized protein LOC122520182 n=1 Tax=Polistes fuscatus TaxID=30207 RepID=UPI001CA99694|nr:uncharacterized protein LOC122520182 [Polistes fuscatus]